VSNLLTLAPRASNKASALAAIDDLRRRVESGEVIAFAAVGIEPGRQTAMWCGAAQPMHQIELYGAVAALMHGLVAGELE
jgi:hypothetical protein